MAYLDENRVAQLWNAVKSRVSSLEASLTNTINALDGTLTDAIDALDTSLTNTINDLDTSLTARIDATDSTINSMGDAAYKNVKYNFTTQNAGYVLDARAGYDLDQRITNAVSDVLGDLATVEASETASKSYSVGEYLVYNNILYKVTSAITQNGTITPGTNCTATTAGSALSTLNTDIANLQFEVESYATPTYATGVEAISSSDGVRLVKYKNGMCHAKGAFTISASSDSMDLFYWPSGYAPSWGLNGDQQLWVTATHTNGANSFICFGTTTKLQAFFATPTALIGYYMFDFWYVI